MPLDTQVEALLAELAAAGGPPISELSVADARALSAEFVVLAGEPIEVGTVRDMTIPVDGGTIGARVYEPAGQASGPRPVVVFFHGGGWVICDLDTHDNVARSIVRDAQVVVVSIDYRMGPEFRFPTAPQDCLTATTWVVDNASELGVDPDRVAVCGDSAGGNLAAVVSQLARDAEGPAIRFAALIYPATDMTDETGSMQDNASGYFLQRDDMEWFMGHYLSDGDRKDPLASPALHPDLAGLPDCFIATCEFDPLRDQAESYAEALRANGADVELKRYDGMIHGIASMTGVLDGGRALMADVADRLQRALH